MLYTLEKTRKDWSSLLPARPKHGIDDFFDITPALWYQRALIDDLMDLLMKSNCTNTVDCVVGVESRGFPLAGAIADRLNVPLLLVRKKGELPGEVHTILADCEYKKEILIERGFEISTHKEIPIHKPLIVDDLNATSKTARAMAELMKQFEPRLTNSHINFLFFVVLNSFFESLKQLAQDHAVHYLVAK